MGNNQTVTTTTYNGRQVNLYFRGARNVEAVLDSLIHDQNMSTATHVIVGGSSAGGLATYLHIGRTARFHP